MQNLYKTYHETQTELRNQKMNYEREEKLLKSIVGKIQDSIKSYNTTNDQILMAIDEAETTIHKEKINLDQLVRDHEKSEAQC